MVDKLQLCNIDKRLQERYDDFVIWINNKNNNVPELLAEELGVDASVVDVFFEIGNLDPEEFAEIDKNKIDVGALFVFVRNKKDVRLKVYKNATKLLSSSQPLKAIREFIDEEKMDFDHFINSISANAWKSIASYLKLRSIDEGALSKRFRNVLFNCAKRKSGNQDISEKMIDWILEAIMYDNEKSLKVFLNLELERKFPDDYKIYELIIENLSVYST